MASPTPSDERAKSRNFAALRPLIGYLKPYRWRVAGAAVALLIAASTVLALGAGLRFLIDRGFVSGDEGLLDRAVLILLGVVALMAAASYCRFYLVSWIGERVIADLRRDVYAHVIALDAKFFETTRAGEIAARLTTDTSVIQVVVGSSVSVALRNSLMLVGGLIMLFVTSVKLTLLVLLVVPLVLVPILTFGRRVRRLSRSSQDRLAEVSLHVDESLAAFRTVQAFTHERHDIARFGARVEDAFGMAIERVRARALLTACVMLLVFGAVSVILWLGGRDVLGGRLTPGELSAFVFYAAVVAGGMGAISEVMADLQRAAGAAERLFEILAAVPAIIAPARPEKLHSPDGGQTGGRLVLHRVSFRYPTRPDRPALDELTLDVRPGEKVAVVGPSGAGKTTLFQLLLRFYDPDTGIIALDGVDLRRADPAALRARIGLVPQDPVIFAASAAENIRYGRPDATDDEVRAAADAAHAREFIERLPERFDSYLGERGVRLSGGQRQRIAIARAILRDPAVLLLDEATSALDAESERAVQDALARLMETRTTLVIAHRLATVQSTDRIVVLDHGRIVAQGRHAELVRQGGLYARLAALQFDDRSGEPVSPLPTAAAGE